MNLKKLNLTVLLVTILVLIPTVQIVYASPLSTLYLSGGQYPNPATYSFWKEGSNYYCKDSYGKQPTWSGSSNASYVIQTSWDASTVSGHAGALFKFAKGDYYITSTLKTAHDMTIKGEGTSGNAETTGGTRFFGTTGLNVMFNLSDSHRVAFEDLHLEGDNKTNYGLYNVGSISYLDLDRVAIMRFNISGVYISGQGVGTGNLRNTRMERSGNWDIQILSGDNIVIESGLIGYIQTNETRVLCLGVTINHYEIVSGQAHIPEFVSCWFEPALVAYGGQDKDENLRIGSQDTVYGVRVDTCVFHGGVNYSIDAERAIDTHIIYPRFYGDALAHTYYVRVGDIGQTCAGIKIWWSQKYASNKVKIGAKAYLTEFLGYQYKNSGLETSVTNGDWIPHSLRDTPTTVILTPDENVTVWVTAKNSTHFQFGVASGTPDIFWFAEYQP